MPDSSTIVVFALASLGLALIPGPAVLYIVARSVGSGTRAGLVSALGVGTGGLVHVLAAVLGVSAIVASSAEAFTAFRLLGAAYLVYLGVRTLLGRDDQLAAGPESERSLWRIYLQGIVVQVLNPKTALFFLALLPQFIDPDAGSVPLQAAILGAVFIVVALVSDAAYALLAGTVADRLREGRARTVQRVFSGSILIGLGLFTALAGERART